MRDLATHQILEEQYGCPRYLTAVAIPFGTAVLSSAIPSGSRLMIQPSAACNIKIGDSTVVAGATQSVGLLAGEKFYCCLKMTDTNVSIYNPAGSGTMGVNIFIME